METDTILWITIPIVIIVLIGVAIGVLFATGILGGTKKSKGLVPTTNPTPTPNPNTSPEPNFQLVTRTMLPGEDSTENAYQVVFHPDVKQGYVNFPNTKEKKNFLYSFGLDEKGNPLITHKINIPESSSTISLGEKLQDIRRRLVTHQRKGKFTTQEFDFQDDDQPPEPVLPTKDFKGNAIVSYLKEGQTNVAYILVNNEKNNGIEVWEFNYDTQKYTQQTTLNFAGNRSNSFSATPDGKTLCGMVFDDNDKRWSLALVDGQSFQAITQKETNLTITGAANFGTAISNDGTKIIVLLNDPKGNSKVQLFQLSQTLELNQTGTTTFPITYRTVNNNITALHDLRLVAFQIKDTATNVFKTVIYRTTKDFKLDDSDGIGKALKGNPAFIQNKGENLERSALVYQDQNTNANILLFTSDDYDQLTLYRMLP